MAQAIYLFIDGVPGESKKTGFEDWIEISSFSNGSSNHSSVSRGTGSGSGKVEFSSINFTKQLDKASPKLALINWKGTHTDKATICVTESTGDTTTKVYYQYDLKQVFVDSISWGAAGGAGSKPSESLSLSFDQIQISYSEQNADGSLNGAITVGWKTSTNTAV